MPDIKQHDPTFFPVFTGLDKPTVSAKPPIQKIGLFLPGKTSGKTVVSASPLHGVTRLSLVVGDQVSETYNNGKGDSTKVGKYFAPVTEVLAFDPEVDKPKICWKVRNTANFTHIKFELFRQGDTTPIWSLSWDKAQTQTNILRGGLDAGSKTQDGQTIPIHWSGSLEWAAAVVLDKGLFPNGRLTIEHSPYQLRMTANNNDPGPGKMGYPLVAWTYLTISQTPTTSIGDLYVLDMVVQDTEGLPYANRPYEIWIDEERHTLTDKTTSANGEIYEELRVKPNQQVELLVWPDDEMPPEAYLIELEGLDSIDTIAGVQDRLYNLGYNTEENGELGPLTVEAIKAFQTDHNLSPTGELNETTKQKLLLVHQS